VLLQYLKERSSFKAVSRKTYVSFPESGRKSKTFLLPTKNYPNYFFSPATNPAQTRLMPRMGIFLKGAQK